MANPEAQSNPIQNSTALVERFRNTVANTPDGRFRINPVEWDNIGTLSDPIYVGLDTYGNRGTLTVSQGDELMTGHMFHPNLVIRMYFDLTEAGDIVFPQDNRLAMVVTQKLPPSEIQSDPTEYVTLEYQAHPDHNNVGIITGGTKRAHNRSGRLEYHSIEEILTSDDIAAEWGLSTQLPIDLEMTMRMYLEGVTFPQAYPLDADEVLERPVVPMFLYDIDAARRF